MLVGARCAVGMRHDTVSSTVNTDDLSGSIERAGPFFLPGTDLTAITTDRKASYDAMIAAFADGVEKRLEQRSSPLYQPLEMAPDLSRCGAIFLSVFGWSGFGGKEKPRPARSRAGPTTIKWRWGRYLEMARSIHAAFS